jgi:hypothetical protein
LGSAPEPEVSEQATLHLLVRHPSQPKKNACAQCLRSSWGQGNPRHLPSSERSYSEHGKGEERDSYAHTPDGIAAGCREMLLRQQTQASAAHPKRGGGSQ